MQATLVRLQQTPRTFHSLDDLFAYMPPEQALAGGRVNMRVPQVFRKVYTEADLGQATAERLTAGDRFTPPGKGDPAQQSGTPPNVFQLFPAGVKLPGYERTYEAEITVEGEKSGVRWPYFLYLAAMSDADRSIDQVAAQVQQMLKAVVAETPDRWENVEITNPESGEVTSWRKLRIQSKFYFDGRPPGGRPEWYKEDGVLVLMLLQRDQHLVMLGYKALAEIEQQQHLSELLDLVAGTVTIDTGAAPKAANPAAAPKIQATNPASPQAEATTQASTTSGPVDASSQNAALPKQRANSFRPSQATQVSQPAVATAAGSSAQVTPGSLLALARESLQAGKGEKGLKLLQAAAAVGEPGVDLGKLMRWSRQRKRPQLAVRWAFGQSVATNRFLPPGSNEFARLRNSSERAQEIREQLAQAKARVSTGMKSQQNNLKAFRRDSFGIGEELLLRLDARVREGFFGPAFSTAHTGQPASNGRISSAALEMIGSAGLSKAREGGFDFLVLAETTVRPIGGQGSRFHFEHLNLRLLDVASGEELWTTGFSGSQLIQEMADAEKTAELIKSVADSFMGLVDTELGVAELPNLSPEAANRRASSLVSAWPADPLAVLCEIRLYESKDLLDQQDVARSFGQLLGEKHGQSLLSGSNEERRRVVAAWAPGIDVPAKGLAADASLVKTLSGGNRFVVGARAGLREAKRNNRPMMWFVVGEDSLEAAKQHAADIFAQEGVRKQLGKFICVLIDADDPQEIATMRQITAEALPAMVFLTNEGDIVQEFREGKPAGEFENSLVKIHAASTAQAFSSKKR